MVTPNLSRNLDLGYGGSFAPASKKDPYFYPFLKEQNIESGSLNYHDLAFIARLYKMSEREFHLEVSEFNHLTMFNEKIESLAGKVNTVIKIMDVVN